MNDLSLKNAGKNIIAFEFSIRQTVLIDAIETRWKIKKIMVDGDGVEYLVSYFDDDKVRRDEWLGPDELSRL